jgi:hypothetical protein
MGRPVFVEKTALSDWGGEGGGPNGFCREFEATLLAGTSDSRDFRLLFAGRDGSGDTTSGRARVLDELFLLLREDSETGGGA